VNAALVFAIGMTALTLCVLVVTVPPSKRIGIRGMRRMLALASALGFAGVALGAFKYLVGEGGQIGWAYFSAGLMLIAAATGLRRNLELDQGDD